MITKAKNRFDSVKGCSTSTSSALLATIAYFSNLFDVYNYFDEKPSHRWRRIFLQSIDLSHLLASSLPKQQQLEQTSTAGSSNQSLAHAPRSPRNYPATSTADNGRASPTRVSTIFAASAWQLSRVYNGLDCRLLISRSGLLSENESARERLDMRVMLRWVGW